MRKIILIFWSLIVWLLLTWTLNLQNVIVGGVVAITVGLIFGNLFVTAPLKIFQFRRWLWFILYIPVFIWEMTKANFDVAYRVLHPKLPITPGIVKVKTKIKSEMGKVILANSITLTPGTFTIDLKDEYLYIHWINVRYKDIEKATQEIVGRFEKYLIKIFD
ncbi:Na+/H+ antiporter subunit E [bacterium]|nr:Na+/H+ antiporter subunit E [bacterium]